jgi:hypothetical protein
MHSYGSADRSIGARNRRSKAGAMQSFSTRASAALMLPAHRSSGREARQKLLTAETQDLIRAGPAIDASPLDDESTDDVKRGRCR